MEVLMIKNLLVLLGLVKKIRKQRPSLRIVICSATIDAQSFLNFFCGNKSTNTGCIISIDGRQHPCDTFFTKAPVRDYLISCVQTVINIHEQENEGDVLVFLPTAEDIDRAIKLTDEKFHENTTNRLHSKSRKRQRSNIRPICLPLYGNLPQNMQARIFQNKSTSFRDGRRIIFSTNIAETSLTVPNIKYVVDTGFVKLPFFDSRNGLERLIVTPISRASAKQRAGRAGRIGPGKCYRLYTENFHSNSLDSISAPEVQRTNLSSFVLSLKAFGIDDVMNFDLISPPSKESIMYALESLFALGAIDDTCHLTDLGSKMVDFPTGDPRTSKMLLTSIDMNCSEEVLLVASIMQVRDIFVRPRSLQQKADFDALMGEIVDRTGDHGTFINLMIDRSDLLRDNNFINVPAVRKANEIRLQLRSFLKRYGKISSCDRIEDRNTIVRRCVASGWFLNIAKLANDGFYYTVKGQQMIKPSQMSSVFSRYGKFSEYIMFGETFDGSTGDLEARFVPSIDGRWLRELAPHYWS